MNPYEPSSVALTPIRNRQRVTLATAVLLCSVLASFAIGYFAGEYFGAESYRRLVDEIEQKNAANTKLLLDEIARLKQP